jgi:hypothetical protein
LKKIATEYRKASTAEDKTKIKQNTMSNFDLRKYLAEGKLLKEEEASIADFLNAI